MMVRDWTSGEGGLVWEFDGRVIINVMFAGSDRRKPRDFRPRFHDALDNVARDLHVNVASKVPEGVQLKSIWKRSLSYEF